MEFCDVDEFKCASGQCIPVIKRCDAYSHCFDGSDEEFCGRHLIWNRQFDILLYQCTFSSKCKNELQS